METRSKSQIGLNKKSRTRKNTGSKISSNQIIATISGIFLIILTAAVFYFNWNSQTAALIVAQPTKMQVVWNKIVEMLNRLAEPLPATFNPFKRRVYQSMEAVAVWSHRLIALSPMSEMGLQSFTLPSQETFSFTRAIFDLLCSGEPGKQALWHRFC